MLNAVNLSFVAFARSLGSMDGQVIVFFVMAVAAAEAAVGLAIMLQLYRIRDTLNADEVDDPAMVNGVAHAAHDLLRWIVILPALGFLWNLFLGRRLPWSAKLVGPGAVLGAFVVSVLAVLRLHGLPEHSALHDSVFSWIQVGRLRRRCRFLARSAERRDDPGRHRRGLPHPRLLRRLHERTTPTCRASSPT